MPIKVTATKESHDMIICSTSCASSAMFDSPISRAQRNNASAVGASAARPSFHIVWFRRVVTFNCIPYLIFRYPLPYDEQCGCTGAHGTPYKPPQSSDSTPIRLSLKSLLFPYQPSSTILHHHDDSIWPNHLRYGIATGVLRHGHKSDEVHGETP